MSILSQPIELFSIGPKRSFGGISGYVTIMENAVDAIEITQHPVQQGASITDHAFKKPIGFSIQMLFRDNQTLSLKDIYQKLLELQSSFVPFNCVTPKRTYFNMLLLTLGQTTDKKTENCLAISATFQEVIIVPVVTTIVPRSQLKHPGSNGGTQKVGKVQSIAVKLVKAVSGQ